MKRLFSIIVAVAIICAACQWQYDPKESMPEIYSKIIYAVFLEDEAMNDNIEFLAVDMHNFKYITDDEKLEIVELLSLKVSVPVYDATMDELKEQGYFDEEQLYLSGVLIEIPDLALKWNNTVSFEAQKYRGGKSAIGIEGRVKTNEGQWRVVDINMLWIS